MRAANTPDSDAFSKPTLAEPDGAERPRASSLPPILAEYVDNALSEAFSRKYHADPIIGGELIRILGPLDSVRRRHGILIERALAHALAAHERFDVQSQVAVPVSRAAIDLCAANAAAATEHLALAISDTRARTAVVDLVVYDREAQRLIVASVKRGGGIQGGAAAQDEHTELRAAAMILRTMIAGQGLPVRSCEPIVVDWFGRSGIVGIRVVPGPNLDEFFGVPVAEVIEAMSLYLTDGVRSRAAEILGKGILQGGAPHASIPDEIAVTSAAETAERKPMAIVIDLEQCLAALPRRTRGRPMQSIRPRPAG